MAENSKGAMAKDTVVYMIAKLIEAVVGIVMMSAMTYLFHKAQMGYYSTVNIAVTMLALLAVQWLNQSVLRYINQYELDGKKEIFFSTVINSWKRVNLISVGAAAGLLILLRLAAAYLEPVAQFMEIYTTGVFVCGILWFVTYNTAQLMIAMLAAVREVRMNLILSVITVCGKLFFMVLFCFLWESRIEWIFLSYFLTDGLVALLAMKRLGIFSSFRGQTDGEILKELKAYGMPLMGNQFATTILNKSDIYIILIGVGAGASGIYQTNYSLVATAFTLINAAIMRGCYPTILRRWAEGKKDEVQELLNEAVRMYLLVAVPAVAGIWAVSQQAAYALFAPEYVEGHVVMFWVALGMMFLGLTEYSIKHWELNSDTSAIFKRSMIGGAVNLGLNLVLVNLLDSYYIAAVTTFIGFFVYFLLARMGTRKYLKWRLKPLSLCRILLSAAVMAAVIRLMEQALPEGKLYLALFIFCGIIVYGFVLVLTGEVRSEIRALRARFLKK
ncbi:MAG: polysaccharide biosynthesis C-terminal domain-containing protein [Anaerovoracaceae bacterium]